MKNGNGNTAKTGSLTITHIRMYEELLAKELNPTIKILEARDEAMKARVTVEVKRDLGVYNLILEKVRLQTALEEVNSSLRDKTSQRYIDVDGGKVFMSPVEAEVKRRLKERNLLLVEVMAFRDKLVKDIKLACGTPEIREMFAKLEPQIKELADKAKKLPGLRLKPLTEADRKVLDFQSY